MFKWLRTQNKQIKDLKKEVEFWQKCYEEESRTKNHLMIDIGRTNKDYAELVSESKKNKEQVLEYKQKYADEVQKRLYLIKQIEELVENELYRNAWEEWEAQDDE